MMESLVKRFIILAFQAFFYLLSRDVTESLPPGDVLVIAPHPDDETFGCGATIARLVSQGRRVRIVCVTDGKAAVFSKVITPAQLAAIRREELIKAAAQLGVSEKEIVFLDYPDSEACNYVKEIADKLAEQIRLCSPGIIFSVYGIDKTSDHRATAEALRLALQKIEYRRALYEYPIWFWPIGALRHVLMLTPLLRHRHVRTEPFLAAKKAAISAHRSQVENITGEEKWTHLEEDFIRRFTKNYELFFERGLFDDP